MPRLQEKYRLEVVPALMEGLGRANPMAVPRLEKVVLNIGLGEALKDAKVLESAERDMTAITGQHPVITRAKRSIAAFKLRTGAAIGMKVTLRGPRMWDFLDKLFNVVLPRVRDFHGVSSDGFDSAGNYHLGFREQLAFPEIDYEKVDRARGLQVSIVTSARDPNSGRRLLELLGMPFAR